MRQAGGGFLEGDEGQAGGGGLGVDQAVEETGFGGGKSLGREQWELLVNLTDMQEHERLNRQAIEAGKHIWSEKPIANSLAAGQELLELARKNGLRLWGAPTVVQSPQFAFMADPR